MVAGLRADPPYTRLRERGTKPRRRADGAGPSRPCDGAEGENRRSAGRGAARGHGPHPGPARHRAPPGGPSGGGRPPYSRGNFKDRARVAVPAEGLPPEGLRRAAPWIRRADGNGAPPSRCRRPGLLLHARSCSIRPGVGMAPEPCQRTRAAVGHPPGKAVVGHFPTRRAIKGTPLILDAFRGLGATSQSHPEPGLTRLENETAVLLVVEDQPHSRALEIMDRCALVIDQVNDLGIYSMVAVEGMARGKVVFSSFDPGLHPFPLPMLRLSSESLGPILEKWLQEPASWTARGREGRDFVERVHRAERVAGQTLRAYYRSLGREKLLGAELKRYWKAQGPGYRGELDPGTERIERAAFGEKVLIDALRGLDFRSYV